MYPFVLNTTITSTDNIVVTQNNGVHIHLRVYCFIQSKMNLEIRDLSMFSSVWAVPFPVYSLFANKERGNEETLIEF